MKNSLPSDLFSFAQVVAAGSFTKAAKELGVSPSVLSKRLGRLEEGLGVELLQRTTRAIRLTDAGKKCYDEINTLKSGFENILQKIESTQAGPKGPLRIGCLASFATVYLERALWDFLALYPEVKVDLVLGQSSLQLMEKNLDVGIFIKELPDSQLVAKKIGMRKMVVCASPDYLQKHGTPQKPEDLLNHNCLLYRAEKIKHQWKFKKSAISVKGNFAVNSSQLLMQSALHGKGIVKLPEYLVKDALKEQTLVSILEEHCPKDIGIYAAYPFTRHPSPTVSAFIEFLAKSHGFRHS